MKGKIEIKHGVINFDVEISVESLPGFVFSR